MVPRTLVVVVLAVAAAVPQIARCEPLPFESKIETYRSEEGDIVAFALRLEQPFLAEEFEQSNKLRLQSLDDNAYLIYPKETKFERKHAEFYGRLKGDGTAKVRLSYEVVSEDLAGKPTVEVRTSDLEITIPTEQTGIEAVYKAWANRQNVHFANLLEYYPETSFFEYVLLQSKDRYGVNPPRIPTTTSSADPNIETGLYHTFSGGLALQQSLQREALRGRKRVGDLSVHVNNVTPPRLQSLDYKTLLKQKSEENVEPHPHELAKAVPHDQYFLQFQSMQAANDLIDLSTEWGESLLRLWTVNARDPHLRQKYEDQLCVRRDLISKLFADQVISELGVTGSDFFIAEGTDLTLLFRLKNADVFKQAAEKWLADVKTEHPNLQERDVNYRGHRISARYTPDRKVSSFVLYKDDLAIFSNSPVVMRKVIDTLLKETPALYDALDYQYVTSLLEPGNESQNAYLYASEAFLKHLVSPSFKIAEKRRLLAFNDLVMLNNASMFYRLEYGRSPESLSDLVKGRFYDPQAIINPTGGAYAWDAERDTATSSVYNRIKYLTPIVELEVLQISDQEKQEYDRYKQRYEQLWQGVFDPLAIRFTMGEAKVKLETMVLPFANGSLYSSLRSLLDTNPQTLSTEQIARSAVASLKLVPGRDKIAMIVGAIPGVQEVLAEDPTLTDMSWLGDRMSLHFLDDDTILEVDPTRFRRLDEFFGVGVPEQTAVSALVTATSLPAYFSIDVEDEDKATRLLDQLSSRIVLKGSPMFGLPTSFDAYHLPDYKERQLYVLSYQFYALKIRLHVALVNGRLVAATKLDALRQAIDAAAEPPAEDAITAHALVRMNFKAMDKSRDDLQLYWNEKLRRAAHRNIMPIYNLIKLYDVPIEDVNSLADSKYGVTYFCPGGGKYEYNKASDQVFSTIFGNRQNARQPLAVNDETAFSKFINSLDELTAALRFTDDGLLGTVELIRAKQD